MSANNSVSPPVGERHSFLRLLVSGIARLSPKDALPYDAYPSSAKGGLIPMPDRCLKSLGTHHSARSSCKATHIRRPLRRANTAVFNVVGETVMVGTSYPVPAASNATHVFALHSSVNGGLWRHCITDGINTRAVVSISGSYAIDTDDNSVYFVNSAPW